MIAAIAGLGLFICVLCVYGDSGCSGSISQSDFDSLEALYYSTGGFNWAWDRDLPIDTRWTFPSTLDIPCTLNWQGLTCFRDEILVCRITALELRAFNMIGPLCPDCLNFTSLQVLELDTNFLNGTIPSQIGLLTNLLSISLERNLLSGQLPAELGQLLQLAYFDIEENNVTGTIPIELVSLSGLQELVLSDNFLSGSLPSEVCLLTSAIRFQAETNLISGLIPACWCEEAHVMEQFNVGYNSLKGPIPSELFCLTSLFNLNLVNNFLTGSIPSEIGQVADSLAELVLFENSLSGQLPSQLWTLTNLSSLQLETNAFTGTLSSQLGNLINLDRFSIGYNFLRGTIPTEIGHLRNVTEIYLQVNDFRGTLPSELGLLTRSKYLQAFNNRFTSSIPPELFNLTLLHIFNMDYNALSGTISPLVSSLTQAEDFRISGNLFTGSIPSQFGSMQLEMLVLDYNLLTSTVPVQLADFNGMHYLSFATNFLTSSLPLSVWELDGLISLYVYQNILSGSFPSQYGRLLTVIEAGANLLTGSIPKGLFNRSLVNINVMENNLSGTLPDITDPKALITFVVATNLLTGTLPAGLFGLENVEILSVASNMFSGSIGDVMWTSTAAILFAASDNLFTGSFESPLTTGTALEELIVYTNYLTQELPSALNIISSLISLQAGMNFFTGTVPSSIFELTGLSQISVPTNLLSGSVALNCSLLSQLEAVDYSCNLLAGRLPKNLTECKKLRELNVAFNSLTGPLPLGLQSLKFLELLNVSRNTLTGQLGDSIDETTDFSLLVGFDVSHNQFSGPIPEHLFSGNRSRLDQVFLLVNCFEGSLPDSVCNADALSTLVLDSASSAPSCAKQVDGRVITALVANKLLSGTIPQCIWDMPRLVTFHASGNGLSGTLTNIAADHIFMDISLSDNLLSGTIPLSWQEFGKFRGLQLASNKLTGSLSADFVLSNTTQTLDLTVNRLSGRIPSPFYESSATNILAGNLFQCQNGRKPSNDPDASDYACGSSPFDISLAVCVSCLGVFAVVFGYELFRSKRVAVLFHVDSGGWLNLLLETGLALSHEFSCFISRLDRIVSSTVWSGACWNLVILPLYVAVKLSASGTSTHAFQYAYTATVSFLHGCIPCVIVLTALVGSLFFVEFRIMRKSPVPSFSKWRGWLEGCSAGRLRQLSIVCALMFIHSAVILAANVVYVALVVEQVNSSLLFWLQFVLGTFKALWNNGFISHVLKELERLSFSRAALVFISVYLRLFSFLLSPIIATLVSDPTCFEQLVTGTTAVTATFESKQFACNFDSGTRDNGEVVTSKLTCRFQLNALSQTTTSPPWLYSFQCSSAVITNYASVLIFAFTMSGLVIPALQTATYFNARVFSVIKMPRVFKHALAGGFLPALDLDGDEKHSTSQQPLFSGVKLTSYLISNIGIMTTFGLAIPFVGMVVCLDSLSALATFRLVVLEFVNRAKLFGPALFANCGSRVEDGCNSVTDADLRSSITLITLLSEIFWIIFVFDMIGDVYGTRDGVLAILAPTLGIQVLVMVWQLLCHHFQSTSPATDEFEPKPNPTFNNARHSSVHNSSVDKVIFTAPTTNPMSHIVKYPNIDLNDNFASSHGAGRRSLDRRLMDEF